MPRDLPAILYEPDGYTLSGSSVMGRQSAGNGFLRAAAEAAEGRQLVACTPHASSAQAFADAVLAWSPRSQPCWLPTQRLQDLAAIGLLYTPDPALARAARLRLRLAPQAYALCGITHTLSSHWAMDAIRQMVSAPLMPWDALICTSHAARAVVQGIWEEEQAYLTWRLGTSAPPPLPALPVIPLGVHTRDFQSDAAQKQAARESLGIGPDEVAMLFMGRLSFHSKAHPHAMYAALQAAARQTGKRVTLVQCGRFGSDQAETAYREGAAQFCPDVRTCFVDGQDEQRRRWAWTAADIFISLADNIQETFGLTPVEAMAAGLPVIVSDWNGYKDTVRDGVDGFRIPTWMPAPGAGDGWARSLEAGAMDFDMYSGLTSQTVALDAQLLTQRLVQLIDQPDLRRRMGQQGQARAVADYDWRKVFVQYQDLWAEQAAIRRAARSDDTPTSRAEQPAPSCDAARQDPFRLFAGYATHQVSPPTLMRWVEAHTVQDVLATLCSPLFKFAVPSDPAHMKRLSEALKLVQAQPLSIQAWAQACRAPLSDMVLLACQLAKVGALTFSSSAPPDQ